MPEAIVALGQAKRLVGRLRFESDGRRQHSQFEYDREWLRADDGFRLAPGLPLQPGGFFASARGSRRNALHGCLRVREQRGHAFIATINTALPFSGCQ